MSPLNTLQYGKMPQTSASPLFPCEPQSAEQLEFRRAHNVARVPLAEKPAARRTMRADTSPPRTSKKQRTLIAGASSPVRTRTPSSRALETVLPRGLMPVAAHALAHGVVEAASASPNISDRLDLLEASVDFGMDASPPADQETSGLNFWPNISSSPSPRPFIVWPHFETQRRPLSESIVPLGVTALPAAMQVIWRGDDSDELHRLLVLPSAHIFEQSGTLGIDSVMLAHRMQRRACSRLLFLKGLRPPAVLPDHNESLAASAIRKLVERPYKRYLDTHSIMVARTHQMACDLVEATLAGEYDDIYDVQTALCQRLLADVSLVPLMPDERNHVSYWILGAILGRILAHFNQDSLLKEPLHCRLLQQIAERLSYPLDREHLYINAPM